MGQQNAQEEKNVDFWVMDGSSVTKDNHIYFQGSCFWGPTAKSNDTWIKASPQREDVEDGLGTSPQPTSDFC